MGARRQVQVRAFAKLHLRRAKSDRIDAVLIAACTHLLDPEETKAADPRLDGLCDQLTFLEQVEADIARLKTRLEHIRDQRLRDMVTADIETLKARRADELRRLIADLRAHADLAGRLDLVLSVPGIGERTALALMLRMPELGAVSREQAAALAGPAPFVQQSGRLDGRDAHRRRCVLCGLVTHQRCGLHVCYFQFTKSNTQGIKI